MSDQPEQQERDDADEGVSTVAKKNKAGAKGKSSSASFGSIVERLKLKTIGNYILDGFPPFVAVIALLVAVYALNRHDASQAKLNDAVSTINSLNASLSLSKGELEKFKAAIAQEAATKLVENNKHNEQLEKTIQSVSKLQVKMKVSPTLEEQLKHDAAASAVMPTASNEIATPQKVALVTQSELAALPVIPVPQRSPAVVAADYHIKTGGKMFDLKKAVDKYNNR